MEKETKKIYTVNISPTVMDKIKKQAKDNRRSLSGEVEHILAGGYKVTAKGEDLKKVIENSRKY